MKKRMRWIVGGVLFMLTFWIGHVTAQPIGKSDDSTKSEIEVHFNSRDGIFDGNEKGSDSQIIDSQINKNRTTLENETDEDGIFKNVAKTMLSYDLVESLPSITRCFDKFDVKRTIQNIDLAILNVYVDFDVVKKGGVEFLTWYKLETDDRKPDTAVEFSIRDENNGRKCSVAAGTQEIKIEFIGQIYVINKWGNNSSMSVDNDTDELTLVYTFGKNREYDVYIRIFVDPNKVKESLRINENSYVKRYKVGRIKVSISSTIDAPEYKEFEGIIVTR